MKTIIYSKCRNHILYFLILFVIACPEVRVQAQAYQLDTDTLIIIGNISLSGNKTTRYPVIKRELLFDTGDEMSPPAFVELLKQSRQNLLNTSLFNFVDIDTLHQSGSAKTIDVHIRFTERWYIWPIPQVELVDRNFNEWWRNKDFSRLNYALYLEHGNFRGRKEKLQVFVKAGYDQYTGLAFMKPNLNKRQTLGAGANISFGRKHEIPYATDNDKQVFYSEHRHHIYSSTVAEVLLWYRPKIHSSHHISLQFNKYKFADTLFILNPDFYRKQESTPYFLSARYEFKSDYRDLKYYPLNGHLFELQIIKYGLGFLQNSNPDIGFIRSSIKTYKHPFPHWYFMAGVTAKVSTASFQPYFFQQGLGYMYDYVRGYEYYVIDGQHYMLIKSNLKYELLRPRTYHLRFIHNERFGKLHLALYVGFHSDFAVVVDEHFSDRFTNRFPNKSIWGNGVGLDLVTYYDKVLRLEYSINHLGEHGLFMHFLAPI